MSGKHFQVGIEYYHKESGRVFLAVSKSKLLTFSNNSERLIAPYFRDRYTMCHIMVSELLEHWHISEERLDEVVTPLLLRDFKPNQVGPFVPKRSLEEQAKLGRALCMRSTKQ